MLDSWHAAECVHICQREVFGSPIGFELPLGVGGQRIIISRLPSLLELAGLLRSRRSPSATAPLPHKELLALR